MEAHFTFRGLKLSRPNTSDGKPLDNFRREQFGATVGGPIKKDRVFYFLAFEQILENLDRPNLE
jgi:hypothetical protein